MKVPAFILGVVLCTCMHGEQARVSPRFRSVYILEMSNSLDQHLASRISSTHVLWVVLDPSSADAVLTDTLDGAFWMWMQKTYPTDSGGPPAQAKEGGASAHDTPPAGNQRGTVFLVDPRKRVVLWSAYDLPKNATPAELDHTATRITNQLKLAFGKK